MTHSQNILIRGVNWLGDAIMTLPALYRLREANPKAKFTLLTDQKLASLWEDTDHFNEILTFKKSESPYEIGTRLKKNAYDTALIFPNSFRSALECWYANIPNRIGYAGNWRSLLLTEPIAHRPEMAPMRKRVKIDIEYRLINHLEPQDFPSSAHHIHQYLYLAKQLGASEKSLAPKLIRKKKSSSLESINASPPYIGLIAGAIYGPAKRWPAKNFIEVANTIIKKHQPHILLLGGRDDREIAKEIEVELPSEKVTNLAGKTSLAELTSILANCDVVLSNDTGPMHLAAAVDTPVVVPFGSTSPDLTGPGLPHKVTSPHHLIRTNAGCSPCFLRKCPVDLRCFKSITVENVLAAVENVLATKN